MRGPKPELLHLTALQQAVLEKIIRRANSPQVTVTRAKIIRAAARGANNQHIAEALKLERRTIRTWRRRWIAAAERLEAAEHEADVTVLADLIHQLLADDPRSGAPSTFTPEQICQIVAVGCEPPEESGRAVSHWTPNELADEVIKRGIVSSISPRSVGRFLKRSRSQASSVSLLAE
jgi:putative transposase